MAAFDEPTVQRGLPVTQLASDAATLDAAAFAQRYARGFLLLRSRLQLAVGPMQTGARRAASLAPTAAADNLQDETSETTLTVFLLRRRDTSSHDFISIGRVDGNDIALPDESVSKFHAFAKETGGAFFLQDARSRNGTSVDALAVPPRGSGPAVLLVPGQLVRFGTVTTSFHDAAHLMGTLRALGAR